MMVVFLVWFVGGAAPGVSFGAEFGGRWHVDVWFLVFAVIPVGGFRITAYNRVAPSQPRYENPFLVSLC